MYLNILEIPPKWLTGPDRESKVFVEPALTGPESETFEASTESAASVFVAIIFNSCQRFARSLGITLPRLTLHY